MVGKTHDGQPAQCLLVCRGQGESGPWHLPRPTSRNTQEWGRISTGCRETLSVCPCVGRHGVNTHQEKCNGKMGAESSVKIFDCSRT